LHDLNNKSASNEPELVQVEIKGGSFKWVEHSQMY
jgi:hypothetical protein